MTEQLEGTAKADYAEWREYMALLEPLADKVAALSSGPDDEQWRKELYQYLYSQIAVGYLFMVSDPKYPEFIPYYNHIHGQGFPNPDDTLLEAVIEEGGVYRIFGYRGKARIASFQLGNDVGSVARMIENPASLVGGSKGVFNLDSATLGEDGAFELILSPERPDGYTGDWWKLEEGANALILRQRHYDWVNETDGRFAIERLDVPAAKPRMTGEEIDTALRKVSRFIEAYGKVLYQGESVRHMRTSNIRNVLTTMDYSHFGGLANQAFIEGMFKIEPDEALIVESDLPASCVYWGFQLADDFWQTIEWVHHQSSLNGFTARIDSDGKLRMVLSVQDPGVPNWLDTVGRTEGFLYGRWTEASDYPVPSVTKVKVADVRKHLPPETPEVSPQERDAAIRVRRQAVQLRRRW